MAFRRIPRKKPDTADLAKPYVFAESIGRSGDTKRIARRGRLPQWFSNDSARQYEQIMTVLEKRGVFVPRILARDRQNPTLIQTAHGGQTVSRRIQELIQKPHNRRQIQDLVLKCARALGRVHAAGIQHGHPHFKNWVISKNTVGLIDFKFTKSVEPDVWNSVNSIQKAFNFDYLGLTLSIHPLAEKMLRDRTNAQLRFKKAVWERVVRPYPCSPQTKKELVQRLLNEY